MVIDNNIQQPLYCHLLCWSVNRSSLFISGQTVISFLAFIGPIFDIIIGYV